MIVFSERRGRMKRYDVVTVGSGLVDAFVRADFKEKNSVMYFPVGTKIQVDDISFSIGGGGINSAMCFSHLGLKTGFLGKIGQGYNGLIILKGLGDNKIDFLGVKSNEHTGYSIILESENKNRTILTFKSASDNLKFNEISLNKLDTKWFYFTSLGGESFKTQKNIALYCKKNEIKLAYNPSSYHTKNGAAFLEPILRNTNFLSLNKEEARMLVKNGNIYAELRKLGPEIVCVTDGENEGGVYDGEFLYRYTPPKIKIKEVTGAGDIFGSSFVSGLIKFGNIEDALKIAVAHAAFAISKGDGIHKRMASWNEIVRIIKHEKFKINKERL